VALLNDVKLENLKCLLSYFERVKTQSLDGSVTFKRIAYSPTTIHGDLGYNSWKNDASPLSRVTLKHSGKIEDTRGAALVDFANKKLGGGVLGLGNVQEEILFTIHPECMVGILFAESMGDEEAILIRGVERYCDYSGYSQKFKYEGPHVSSVVQPKTIIVIDAIDYSKTSQSSQYNKVNVKRELSKAFIGFFGDRSELYPIATGKWGCGAFGGDPQLKFIIQWLAASKAKREVIFYTTGDKNLSNADRILQKYGKAEIREVVKMIELYASSAPKSAKYDLFTFMLLLSQNSFFFYIRIIFITILKLAMFNNMRYELLLLI